MCLYVIYILCGLKFPEPQTKSDVVVVKIIVISHNYFSELHQF